jgi:hypothetical protein
MVSTSSQISLSNRALSAIGSQASVTSILPSDNTTQGDACSLLFIPTFTQLARTSWWNCLRAQTGYGSQPSLNFPPLSLLAAAVGTPENPNGTTLPTPPGNWLYAYQEPVNCLKARAIIPYCPPQNTGVPIFPTGNQGRSWFFGIGQIPFEVGTGIDKNGNPLNLIFTNQRNAMLQFIVNNPNPAFWDSQLEAAFVAALAAFLVPALALHLPLMQGQIAIADRMIASARASDANEGSNTQDHQPDWITARSGGYYSQREGWSGPGYDQMSWGV